MDFLLECIGFPPHADLVALARRVRERGRRAPAHTARGRAPEHLRLTLAGGLEVQLIEPERGPGATWERDLLPGFRAAPAHAVHVRRSGPEAGGGAWIAGTLATVAPANHSRIRRGDLADRGRRFGGGHRSLGGPAGVELRASVRDAARPPRTGGISRFALTGFAVDVAGLDEPGPSSARTAALRAGTALEGWSTRRGWIGPVRDRCAPRTVVELDLPIDSVSVLENPLTGEPVDLLTVLLPSGRLPLFTSRWQLAEDRLPRPEPGMWVRGAFWVVAQSVGPR